MSYLKKQEWELVPADLPPVRKNCPKCNGKTYFINSQKFRVNANSSSIDIWLIYQCEKCKSTWNMPIYERAFLKEIGQEDYHNFVSNDREMVKRYSFDKGIYSKNGVELMLEELDYIVTRREKEEYCSEENQLAIDIRCEYPTVLRVDKLLSDTLHLSRSQIKRMDQKHLIHEKTGNHPLKSRVKNGMSLTITIM
ncbi:MAG: DUF1062 domain-containing protein [Lachnospiraceae bacterium]|nr:DUF1062 domain-containing protein [Lachnospiraceae bacterium]